MLKRVKRSFTKEEPNKDARKIYIFCEGLKREYQYFSFFKEVDSRINIIVHKLSPDEDNSPRGLFEIAQRTILEPDENASETSDFQENDEVWIVIDVDKDEANSRETQIQEIQAFCTATNNWFVVQSNPCFEVWLHYHFNANKQSFQDDDKCTEWKNKVNNAQPGGFDSRKYAVYIQTATEHSKNNFELEDATPLLGCTEVHQLAESMLVILKDKIDNLLEEN